MAIQLSTAIRNASVGTIESIVGVSAVLKIRTGEPPENVAAEDSGDVLATLQLSSDWLTAPSSGSVSKNGTWEDNSADAAGNAGHFRIYEDDGETCHIQGTVTMTGGGGDMTVNNTNFASGQPFTITNFSLTAGNA